MKSFWAKVLMSAVQSLVSATVLASDLPEYDVREELDKNGDGKADCFVYKKDDIKVMEEIDSDFNGAVDMRRVYNEHGRIVRTQVLIEPKEEQEETTLKIDTVEVEPTVSWNNSNTQ